MHSLSNYKYSQNKSYILFFFYLLCSVEFSTHQSLNVLVYKETQFPGSAAAQFYSGSLYFLQGAMRTS